MPQWLECSWVPGYHHGRPWPNFSQYLLRMEPRNDRIGVEHLRMIRGDLGEIKANVRELQTSMGGVETGLADLHRLIAEQSVRIDHLAGRVERIETRLELVSP